MKMRPLFALAATALMLAAGCSRAGQTNGTTGTLRLDLQIEPTQLNTILSQNQDEAFIDGLIFDYLVTTDANGNLVPDLAAEVPTVANGGITDGGLTITYHLRRGVTWQDGTPFTSKDVKFTWQAIMNPANNVVSRHGYDMVKSVDTPNDYTVVFHMKKVFPPAVATLFAQSDTPMGILPAHLLAQYPNLNNLPFDAAPIGTGPFKFVRWIRGDRIVLERNDRYFLGKPKLKRIIVKLITDDNTVESELRSHELDLGYEITAPVYRDLESDHDIRLMLARAPAYTAILFNTTRPPLDDVLVRRAIAYAIDKEAIIRDDTAGTAEPATADLSHFYRWAYDSTLKPFPYDPKRAAALLDQAGWTLGPDGYRYKNGKRLSLQLVYGQGSILAQNLVVQVQAMLKKVGIEVDPKSYNYAILYAAEEAGGILNSGKFDMTVYSWISGTDPDDSSTWTCAAIPPNGNNVSRFCDPEMDRWEHIALSTFDQNVRANAYRHTQEILMQQVPAVFLYYTRMRYALAPTVQGFDPNGLVESWNAYQWSN
jgi:peptide/nickel transport system substrate-binding protein